VSLAGLQGDCQKRSGSPPQGAPEKIFPKRRPPKRQKILMEVFRRAGPNIGTGLSWFLNELDIAVGLAGKGGSRTEFNGSEKENLRNFQQMLRPACKKNDLENWLTPSRQHLLRGNVINLLLSYFSRGRSSSPGTRGSPASRMSPRNSLVTVEKRRERRPGGGGESIRGGGGPWGS